jgi:hypothetical protein
MAISIVCISARRRINLPCFAFAFSILCTWTEIVATYLPGPMLAMETPRMDSERSYDIAAAEAASYAHLLDPNNFTLFMTYVWRGKEMFLRYCFYR